VYILKICLGCEKTFPSRIKIEGKLHILSSRKYCLECSPFNQHNTKKIHIKTESTVMCRVCEKYYEKGHQKYKDICPTCRVAEVRKQRKKELIEYKGGKCIICDYNKCIKALEFHHVNPSEKKFGIANATVTNIELLKEEADKCVLVCSNCHMEIHAGLVDVEKFI
jgi:hypothetical protein